MEYEAFAVLPWEACVGLVVALSDTTTNLLSALLGAIVGGAASLAGSIVVGRWSRVSDARLRLYDELLPEATSTWEQLRYNIGISELHDRMNGTVHALRRASVVAGQPERRAADAIVRAWDQIDRAPHTINPETREAVEGLRVLGEHDGTAGASTRLEGDPSARPVPTAHLA